jgi:hypothetical protein
MQARLSRPGQELCGGLWKLLEAQKSDLQIQRQKKDPDPGCSKVACMSSFEFAEFTLWT